jgi:hypothetical protein
MSWGWDELHRADVNSVETQLAASMAGTGDIASNVSTFQEFSQANC